MAQTPEDTNPTGDPTVVGLPTADSGANATYQLGHRVQNGEAWDVKDAALYDGPTLANAAQDSRQVFETTALAIDGEQAGTYYGSVRWGWRTDGDGNFTKLPLEAVSMGNPSETFMDAAELWNESEDADGNETVDLPIRR